MVALGAAGDGQDRSYDVFISHKSEYKPWVEWLGRCLIAQGRSVFLDLWNLVPGESWVEGLHRGIEGCRAAVLLATPEVVHSGWVREEYNRLQQRRQSTPGFRLVPIVFGDLPNLPFLANLQAVDGRDPARFREWFHRILCGLDGKEPGPTPMLAAPIDPPPALAPPRARDTAPGEAGFVKRLVARVTREDCPPILVGARGGRFQGPVIQSLLERARATHGDAAVVHVIPPFSEPITAAECFREIARQCGLAQPVADANAFVAAFKERVDAGGRVLMLVTGFESAAPLCRREFASALRALTEQRLRTFRVVLFGGRRLMEQKYGAGLLSVLSQAQVEQWPQPAVDDLLAWQQRDHPAVVLDPGDAAGLLAATGAHAGLVRHCLDCWETLGGTPRWADWSYECPELWETWYRLQRDCDELRLRELLARDLVGGAVPWPPDAVVRQIYWADLLSARGRQLGWGAEVVREVGREVLG